MRLDDVAVKARAWPRRLVRGETEERVPPGHVAVGPARHPPARISLFLAADEIFPAFLHAASMADAKRNRQKIVEILQEYGRH